MAVGCWLYLHFTNSAHVCPWAELQRCFDTFQTYIWHKGHWFFFLQHTTVYMTTHVYCFQKLPFTHRHTHRGMYIIVLKVLAVLSPSRSQLACRNSHYIAQSLQVVFEKVSVEKIDYLKAINISGRIKIFKTFRVCLCLNCLLSLFLKYIYILVCTHF